MVARPAVLEDATGVRTNADAAQPLLLWGEKAARAWIISPFIEAENGAKDEWEYVASLGSKTPALHIISALFANETSQMVFWGDASLPPGTDYFAFREAESHAAPNETSGNL